MATTTNGNTTSKIVRIQDDEKELLSQLRGVYGNNYKKYFLCIRRGSNIPLSIKKIYKLLDERKAYRRISDYFHRERIGRKGRNSKSNGHHKSHHRPSTRHIMPGPQSMSAIQMDHEMYDGDDDDVHHQSTNSTTTNHTEELSEPNPRIDDDTQDVQPTSSSVNSTEQQKRRLSLINNQQPSINKSVSQSDLLSIRTSIQKALRELDRVIISKSDDVVPDKNDDEQQRSVIQKPNDQCHSKLDDIVRSLSTVVHQQQENVHLIINESSALLVHENTLSEKLPNQDSIKHILERLNTLVDRGHTVYDRIENILSEF